MADNKQKTENVAAQEVVEPANVATDPNKEIVRKAFKDADNDVTFDDVDVTPKELTDALVALDISFVVGDMPHKTEGGGITYKKTLIVSEKEKIRKIIDGKD